MVSVRQLIAAAALTAVPVLQQIPNRTRAAVGARV